MVESVNNNSVSTVSVEEKNQKVKRTYVAGNFEGPLDLLLHLVKESNIDIRDIKIIEITAQYLEYIHKMEEMNIDVASEYLVMAATLMEIKSKCLLPDDNNKSEDEDDEEVSRENLIKLS